ncbi:MAG TPA: hypothetical protein VLV50_20520 [Stellaceae bacterium]|nr:hypothetical protein [Stellaceae bacterium]
MASPPLRVRCRQIRDEDEDAVINLLLKARFGGDHAFWADALKRLARHPTPAGFPKYGYLLEVNGVPAGMLLLISSLVPVNGQLKVRCNVSSWYVFPAFRAYASILARHALRHKEATYFNISPTLPTTEILAAQGYTRYCDGHFIAVPALSLRGMGARVEPISPAIMPGAGLSLEEIGLLYAHLRYGCISVVVSIGGRRYPFVFEPMTRLRVLRFAHLAYSPSIKDFVRFAGPLGRFLARRGIAFVVLDANGAVPGLVGHYRQATPKYFRGPDRPRLGDIAYSERDVLGLRFPPDVGTED